MYCAFPCWSTGSCFALQALGSPMDLDVRSACRLLHNILIYIYIYIYIYIRHSQANLQLGLSDRQQSPALISTMHLYQQLIISQANTIGFIRPSTITRALISTINDHFQVSFPVVSSNSTTPYHTRDHSLL